MPDFSIIGTDTNETVLTSDLARLLIAQTLTLYERIELFRTHPDLFAEPSSDSDRLVARWQTSCARGDEELFCQRLLWEGLEHDSASLLLAPLKLPRSHKEPSWIETLREVLSEMPRWCSGSGLVPPEVVRQDREIVFQHYWQPWIKVAQHRLEVGVGPAFALLPGGVRCGLLVSLLEDLTQCGRACLFHEFDRFRFSKMSPNELVLGAGNGPPSIQLYSTFMRDVLGPRRLDFLMHYGFLARQACTVVELWVNAAADFLRRLDQDSTDIAARFASPAGIESVRAISTGLSDPHNGARRVHRVHFSSGLKLVYKPRSVASEAYWSDIMEWLDRADETFGFRIVGVLDRGTHGWVEMVEEQPPVNDSESRRYFENAGVVLGIAHMLDGVDLHVDNVVANPSHPVFVDLETLLAPRPDFVSYDSGLEAFIASSVLRTGFLPGDPAAATDVNNSGISSLPQSETPPAVAWINTDYMALAGGPASSEARNAGNQRPSAIGRGEIVAAGFERLYRSIAKTGARLCAADGVLWPFSTMRARFVHRGTEVYARLLQQARRPEYMRDGVSFSFCIDRLALAYLSRSQSPPPSWRLLEAEHRSLARGDLPLFSALADSHDLCAHDTLGDQPRIVIQNFFSKTSWQRLLERLGSLCDADRELESSVVEWVLTPASVAEDGLRGPAKSGPTGRPSKTRTSSQSSTAYGETGDLLAAGVAIAQQLAAAAIADSGDSLGWMSPSRGPHTGSLVGPTLYEGQAGIAFFLAAAHHVSGDRLLRIASLASLRPLRRAIADDARQVVRSLGLGGFLGVGGLVYGFGHILRLAAAPSFLDDIHALVGAIDETTIAEDHDYDLVSGAAGCILSMAATASLIEPADVQRIVDNCAQHLVANAVVMKHDSACHGRSSVRDTGPGIAHGTAGIALALFEAWRITGNRVYRRAAVTVVEGGDRFARDTHSGSVSAPRAGALLSPTWCRGAPGLALARLRMLDEEDVAVAAEFELLLEATRSTNLDTGHLCCGMAGVHDILLEIGVRRRDATLVQLARAASRERVAAAESGWCLHPERPPHNDPPGLMDGLAGVGYGLLRQNTPSLPSVLDLSG